MTLNDVDLDTNSNCDEEDINSLKLIAKLLKKLRKFVKLIRNTNNILKYVRSKQKEFKLQCELIKDFKIRWNYTCLFLSRILIYKEVIELLQNNANSITGITNSQIKALKKLALTEYDWTLILVLIEVLSPFLDATKMLSGRQYPTLSLSYVVLTGLRHYLENDDEEDEVDPNDIYINYKNEDFCSLRSSIKYLLLTSFNKYTKKHISDSQNEAILVCIKKNFSNFIL